MINSEIKIYKSEDGSTEIQVKFENETVWLSQKQISELFEKDTDTIGLHLKNICKSSELDEVATTEKYSVVQKEGQRKVQRSIKFYNLDAIISVGYRVNSKRGISKILKEYLVKGYALNERRLTKQTEELIASRHSCRFQCVLVVTSNPMKAELKKNTIVLIAENDAEILEYQKYFHHYKSNSRMVCCPN